MQDIKKNEFNSAIGLSKKTVFNKVQRKSPGKLSSDFPTVQDIGNYLVE